VQVLLADQLGRLRIVASEGEHVAEGRLRSARRRQVFTSQQPVFVSPRSSPGDALAIYPLVGGGDSVGVVEVVAPSQAIEERREVLEAVVAQSAAVFASAREKQDSENALRAIGAMLQLAGDLMRSETPVSAVRATVQLCHQYLGVPIAGLLPDRSGVGWFVAAVRGIGSRKRSEFRTSSAQPGVRASRDVETNRLASRFRAIVGCDHVDAVRAEDAVLLVANASPAYGEFLDSAGSLLDRALDHVGAVSWAHLRNDNLDLGIAWTAHELRGPLVGARAALDHLLNAKGGVKNRELLHQTRAELQQLADLVDPLLRWSAGSGVLRRRPSDLVRIAGEAVASCRLEFGERLVVVEAPERLRVRADPAQLRLALANVIRNALIYSPPASPVEVVVRKKDGVAQVCVKDRGPGVPAAERHLIFDPFARGRASLHARGGKGLGLFIASRIIDAHGGTIRVRSARPGATFCIELPREKRRATSTS
jgi:signal transduction histidine kinase